MSDPTAGEGPIASDAPVRREEQLKPGARLGKYRILALLGSGGMGNVYFAEHDLVGRHVAIKRLHPKFLSDPDIVGRFFGEGRVVNAIKHPNMAQITDFVSEGSDAYYVMELLKGRTVKQLIDTEGALHFRRACHIALQLCSVLTEVHKNGIIHRDLKPENLFLVERDGDPDFLKLIDFGVARARELVGNRTAVGFVVGTPAYMAPEQLDSGPVDHRCDIYALGVVMFQMVTAKLPFEADSEIKLFIKHAAEPPPNPRDLAPRPIPRELEQLILACLEKQPSKRPYDCREIADDLRRIATLPDPEGEEWEVRPAAAIDIDIDFDAAVDADVDSAAGMRSTPSRLPTMPARVRSTPSRLPTMPARASSTPARVPSPPLSVPPPPPAVSAATKRFLASRAMLPRRRRKWLRWVPLAVVAFAGVVLPAAYRWGGPEVRGYIEPLRRGGTRLFEIVQRRALPRAKPATGRVSGAAASPSAGEEVDPSPSAVVPSPGAVVPSPGAGPSPGAVVPAESAGSQEAEPAGKSSKSRTRGRRSSRR